MSRLADAFAGGRVALMPYLMGGFPDLAGSLAIGEAYARAGADVVELGVPFSDPLADGPVIHAAATRALAAGATLPGVIEVAKSLSRAVPVVVMCYANPILARGVEPFAAMLADAGVSGLIVPDLPMEEAPATLAACDAVGVDLVPLVAPTTPERRLQAIGSRARGFIYVVSTRGTTGERASLGTGVAPLLARAKQSTDVPVALGFGISTPAQGAEAARVGADGIIIGTRLVRAAVEADDAPATVGELLTQFAAALPGERSAVS